MNGLAVIVVNYRTPDLAIRCVDALATARAAFPNLRVMVVDGGSADGSADRLADALGDRVWVTLLRLDLNGGFAFANNRAIAALGAAGSLPDAIALINPDARVRPGALEAMAALLDREPRAGAVGGLLIHEDGRPQSSAFRFPSVRGEFCRGARTRFLERLIGAPPSSIFPTAAAEVPWVTGAAVMLRTQALEQVGIFDDGFFLYFEETELMLRMRRAGWTIWHEPTARVVHDAGVATAIRDRETGLPTGRRMPRYWHESRRRYFALQHGRGYSVAAGLAFLAGHAVWRLRRLVATRPDRGPSRSGRDLIAYGLWPMRRDSEPSARSANATAAARPAWMTDA